MSKNADTQQQLSTRRNEAERTTAKRPGDRRWMLQWLARGKASHHDWQQLSYFKRLRVLWWGLRGGRKLARFRECITDQRELRFAFEMTRRLPGLW